MLNYIKLFLLISFLLLNNSTQYIHAQDYSNEISPKQLERLINTIKIIKTNFIKNLSDEEIVNYMIDGFLKQTDQYGNLFIENNSYQNFSNNLDNAYNGIGIFLDAKLINGVKNFYVQEITPNSIAQKAGILLGDIVKTINNKTIEQEGPVTCDIDQNINLHIKRLNQNLQTEKEFNILLACENIKKNQLSFEVIEGNIGLLKINSFFVDLSGQVSNILKASSNNLKGLIVDLRNNGGGLEEEMIKLSSIFLEPGQNIAYAKNMQDKQVVKIDSKKEFFLAQLKPIKIIILINENSASASEIFTGALKDHKRALICGKKSYGKGLGQSIFALPNENKFLKLTTKTFFTPLGNPIQDHGIIPDIEIDQNLSLPQINSTNIPLSSIKDFEIYVCLQILKAKILE